MRLILATTLWGLPILAILFYDIYCWCRNYRNGYRGKMYNSSVVIDLLVIILIIITMWRVS